jgi:hypothetical protein
MSVSPIDKAPQQSGGEARRQDADASGAFMTCPGMNLIVEGDLVEPDGIEPTTSSMPLKRSPN